MPRPTHTDFAQPIDLHVCRLYANQREAEPATPPPASGRKAPTEFLIWRAGDNTTDHGEVLFTRRSAEVLMREQRVRGNEYSIDIDHLSLKEEAPIESHRAVGWHTLAVRLDANGDPELWAVDVRWTDTVRA